MLGLALREPFGACRQRRLVPGQAPLQTARAGAGATGQVVGQQGVLRQRLAQSRLDAQVIKQRVHQHLRCQATGFAMGKPQPVGKGHERSKGRHVQRQQQRQGLAKAARVGHQVPEPGKPGEALQRGRIHHASLQHGVRRFGLIDHAVLKGVTGNRRAAQAFQNAQLNLVGLERMQLVKALGKAGQSLAWQTKNQVGVQVGVGLIDQPAQVGQRFGVVLLA